MQLTTLLSDLKKKKEKKKKKFELGKGPCNPTTLADIRMI